MSTVYFHTFGCKANQYDTERMRQEAEARGAVAVRQRDRADVCVVNTCTVTNQADAEARRFIRRLHRENPSAKIVVAGCSAALRAREYRAMVEVAGVVEGHDPVAVALAARTGGAPEGHAGGRAGRGGGARAGVAAPLVQLALGSALDRVDTEPVGAELLQRRQGATRGWLKVQDGCDRHCGFCATRLARGASRSRDPGEVVAEAKLLAASHPELVITGIHIGHYGRDLGPPLTLSRLVARLLDAVADVRLRLGSIEATEVDDLLLDLLGRSGERLAPHLHMPLQSGADPVLRRMRRWHTREGYRRRALEIAGRLSVLGLGADVITGFPGESEADHEATVALVEELPYTYLHVFPFSPRQGTPAAELHRDDPVVQRVAAERARELRELAQAKERSYRAGRAGGPAEIALERPGGKDATGLTEDYLRVEVRGASAADPRRLHRGVLEARGGHLYIDLSREIGERAGQAAPGARESTCQDREPL